MLKFNDTKVSVEGTTVRFSAPIAKVDAERRLVHGFATLDNVDKQDDVVEAEASLEAFANFRNNVREMHQPIAVGKVISFKSERYYDQETEQFYNGVWVTAYVSKGAEDTWQKVLDGTLTGFSIGGEVIDSESVFDEVLNKVITYIKKYRLSELSLVDNPANQLANLFSIEKGIMTGPLSKVDTENVFWCRTDDIISMSKEESNSCQVCDAPMSNIGFVETKDSNIGPAVKAMVAEIKKSMNENIDPILEGSFVNFDGEIGRVERIISAGKVMMANSDDVFVAKSDDPVAIIEVYAQNDGIIETTSRRAVKYISTLTVDKIDMKEVSKMDEETVVVDEVVKSDEVVENVVEKADATEEVAKECADDEMDKTDDNDEDDKSAATAAKADGTADLLKSIDETLNTVMNTLADTVKALNDKVDGIHKSLDAKIGEVAAKADGINSEVDGIKDSFGKRVDAVEKDTAFRKSADLGEIVQEQAMPVSKSVWGGNFLTSADIFK